MPDQAELEKMLRETKEMQDKVDATVVRAEVEADMLRTQLEDANKLLQEKGYSSPEEAQKAATEAREQAATLLQQSAEALKGATK